MSSDDEDGFCRFGTPLDPIEEDDVPSTKKITLADQIAVDSNGKRRFHGAFTGGFSAGYWNTVGSRDGWTPSEFKSSRGEKATRRVQRPSDFMDEEDVGEFGIAPQRIQTTEDFGSSEGRQKNKRKLVANSEGPIPGIPVLELVLESCHDKAAVRLLKRMDKRYAAALAEKTKKQTEPEPEDEIMDAKDEVMESKETDEQTEETATEDVQEGKVYKCDMGPMRRPRSDSQDSESSSSDDDEELVFDEDEYDSIFDNFKTNRFGLEYKGLDKGNFFTIVGAEAPNIQNNYGALSTFTMVDQNKKRVTIKGQAFGVGAFEEDDDDIYGRDDMSKYDFRLDTQKENGPSKSSKTAERSFIVGFTDASKTVRIKTKNLFKVMLPHGFEPRNWLKRKSRFGPETVPSTSQVKGPSDKVIGRHDLTPDQRGQILGNKKESVSDIDAKLKAVGLKTMNFTSGGVENKTSEETVPVKSDDLSSKIDENLNKLRNKSFVVPETIPQIFDRFTSSNDSKPLSELDPPEAPKVKEAIPVAPKEVQKVTRTRSTWVPCQLLCYKMNMEASVGTKPEKGNTFSLFECIASTESARRNRLEFTNSAPENEQAEMKRIAEKFNEQKNNTNVVKEPVLVPKLEDIPMPAAPMVQSNVKDSPTQAEEKSESNVIKRVVKPKTELEMKIASTQGEHPSKKKDIFKAIFDSDSEDESSDENGESNDDSTVSKSTAISTDLMASLTKPSTSSAALYAHLPDDAFKPKSAREINILRNTSPPRGIFSGLTRKIESAKVDSITEQSGQETSTKEPQDDPNSYGPSLPPVKVASSSNGQPDSSRSQSDKSNPLSSSSLSSISLGKTKVIYEEKWIEKSSERSSERSSEKEKKSKKEKKHKKDKHKSKKPKKDKDKHKKKKR